MFLGFHIHHGKMLPMAVSMYSAGIYWCSVNAIFAFFALSLYSLDTWTKCQDHLMIEFYAEANLPIFMVELKMFLQQVAFLPF